MAPPDFTNDDRFDGLYLNIANQTQGIEPLLDSVFSFLRRKSDFFSGPPGSGDKGTEAAIATVQSVLQKHADIYSKDKKKRDEEVKRKEAAKKKKQQEDATRKKREAGGKEVKIEEDVIELDPDGGFDISQSPAVVAAEGNSATKSNDKSSETKPAASSRPAFLHEDELKPDNDGAVDEKSTGKEGGKGEEDDTPPPIGNGGAVDGKYVWTQTLEELVVSVPLPDNTRGRDLNVVMNKTRLKVGLKGHKDAIVDDKLTHAIIVDDSFWTVEDGNRLILTLQKLNQMEWWDGVCQSDPRINVQKVQPENSQLSDLDGETRQTVEKMMYDQRQKALGLPTAEEQRKNEMLEKFKLAHPEMDFSQAKVNM